MDLNGPEPSFQLVSDTTTEEANPFDKFGFAQENPFDKFGFAEPPKISEPAQELGNAIQLRQQQNGLDSDRKQTEGREGVLGSWGKLSEEERKAWSQGEYAAAVKQRTIYEAELKRQMDQITALQQPGQELPPMIQRGIDLARKRVEEARKREAQAVRIVGGGAPSASVSQLRNIVDQVPKGLMDSFFANLVKSAGRAGGYLGRSMGYDISPDNNEVVRFGEQVTQLAERLFPGDVARQQEFVSKLANGAGQMVGFMGPGVVAGLMRAGPKLAGAVTAGMGAGVSGEEQFKAATEAMQKRGDVSEEDRFYSYLIGLGLGTSEALPISRMFRGGGRTLGDRIVEGATTEGLQEGFQTFGGNVTARLFYDPNRKLSEGVVESMAIGGILGGGFGSLVGGGQPADPSRIDSSGVNENVPLETPPPLPDPERLPSEATELEPSILPGVDAGQVVRLAQSVGIDLDENTVQAIVEPELNVPPPLPETDQAFQNYIVEGGDLNLRRAGDIARTLGIQEGQIPELMRRAEEAGFIRRNLAGDYRRGEKAIRERNIRRTGEELAGALSEAMQSVGAMVPSNVSVEMFRPQSDADPVGMYQNGAIAVSAVALDPQRIIRHEAIHALREMDLIQPEEWTMLLELAQRRGVGERVGSDGQTLEQAYREAYADRDNADEAVDQEFIAELLQDYREGQRFNRQVDTILQKIMEFLAALGNALRGRGFQTVDDVINRMMSGEMASRAGLGRDMSSMETAQQPVDDGAVQRGQELRQRLSDLEAELEQAAEPEFIDQESGEQLTPQDVDALVDMWSFVREVRRRPKPQSLVQYIRKELGGLIDEGGDVSNIIGGPKGRPGLINSQGVTLDDAALTIWQAGYLPEVTERPTINDLLEAIDTDINGGGVFNDLDAAEDLRIADEMENDLDEIGIAGYKSEADIRAHFAGEGGSRSGGRAADLIRTEIEEVKGQIQELGQDRDPVSYALQNFDRDHITPGLDMSQEARLTRARDMGFDTDTVWYHGSPHGRFDEFEIDPRRSQSTNNGFRGVSFTPSQKQAAIYGSPLPFFTKRLENPFVWKSDKDGMHPELQDDRWGFSKRLAEQGHDGIIIHSSNGEIGELVIFDPSNIRSVNAAFDPARDGSGNLMYALQGFDRAPAIDDLGYYSKAVEAAKSIKQARGTPEQMLAQLKKAGVKQSEIDATGLEDFLDSFGSRADADLTLGKSGSDWVVKLPDDNGYVAGSVSSGRLEIGTAWVDESIRGEGAAVRMYRRLIDEALDDGLAVNSDRQVSGSARRVYDSLERRGYRLEINPNAQEFGERGLNAPPGEPAISIVAKPKPAQVTRDGIVAFLELQRVPVRESVYWGGKRNQGNLGLAEFDDMSADDLLDALQSPAESPPTTGDNGPAKWQSYSLDPSNPTYKETVLHLPVQTAPLTYENFEKAFLAKNPTGNPRAAWDRADAKGRQEYLDQLETTFYSGHFDEPNAISHLRTSIQPDADGKQNYVINELQSDWGQKIRDSGGARDEAKIAELEANVENAKIKLDDIVKEAKEFNRKHANHIAAAQELRDREAPHVQHQGDLYKVRLMDLSMFGEVDLASRAKDLIVKVDDATTSFRLLGAELNTAKSSAPGHPLVNTTDQWVNTSLRRALRQAVEADADYIAIASGETVDSFGMGAPLEGLKYAYNEMYPKKLRDIIKKLDKEAAKPEKIERLYDHEAVGSLPLKKEYGEFEQVPFVRDIGDGFTRFPLTPKLKKEVMEQGQPLFALRQQDGLEQQAQRQPITGVNEIIRNLALDLGIPVRQGIKTIPSKMARRREGADFTAYYDPTSGVMRASSFYNGVQSLRDIGQAAASKLSQTIGQPLNELVNAYAFELAGPPTPVDEELQFTPVYGDNVYSGVELDAEAQTLLMDAVTKGVVYQAELTKVSDAGSTGYMVGRKVVDRQTLMQVQDAYGQALKRLRRKVGNQQAELLMQDVRNNAPVDPEATAFEGQSGRGIDVLRLPEFMRKRYSESGTPTPAAPIEPSDVFQAFNEFVGNFVVSPNVAKANAPDFYDQFTLLLDRDNPQVLASLEKAQAELDRYQRANPRERLQSMITYSPQRFMFRKFRDNWDRFGLKEALSLEFHDIYTARISSNHPYAMAVRELLDIAEADSGIRISLKKSDNPNATLRMMPHAKIHAARDIEEGIRQLDSTDHSGPSIISALQTALGDNRWEATETGPGSLYREFGAYLMARMGVKRWERYENAVAAGDTQGLRAPYQIDREGMERAVVEYEQFYPQFVEAAEQLYQYQRNLLRIQRDGHLITPEQYEELIQDEDYVPSLRTFEEMGDLAPKPGRSGIGKIIKRFRGSQRNVIDPIASIAQKTFDTRIKIIENRVKLQLLDLAEAAGPGGGMIAERMDMNAFKPVQVSINQALKNAAREAGVSRHDLFMMTDFAQQILGEDPSATILTRGQVTPGREPVMIAYENGKQIGIRLGTDGENTMGGKLAQMIFNLHQTHGEAAGTLVNMAGFFSNTVRAGIVTHPEFFLANLWRDGFMAAMYDPRAVPFWTQIRGAIDIARESDAYQRYLAFGGMMGGEATQLVKLRADNDVQALVERGYKFKVWDNPSNWLSQLKDFFDLKRHGLDKLTGGFIGGLTGAAVGAPITGAVIGATIGAQPIIKFGELSETATRVRLMDIAYKRGLKAGLSDVEAAQEAALWSHDYTDYSRHGSKMEAMRRSVAFLNAGLQGTDIYFRRLMATGDRGTNVAKLMMYPAYRLGLVKFDDITQQEKQDLAFSAWTWMYTTLGLGGLAMALSALYDDDERLAMLPEHVKTNHWAIPLEDVVHLISKDAGDEVAKEDILLRLPKPFQTVWFGNLIERIMQEKMKDDPRWKERFLADLALMNMPPVVPAVLETAGDLMSGRDSFTGRDIVPSFGQGARRRAEQYSEYTSPFGKWAGENMDISPGYADYLVKKLGTSWGRTFLQTNFPGLPWYDPNKPEVGLDQVFIARRFLWKHGRGSEAERVVRQDIMGGEDAIAGIWERMSIPYSKLGASAASYRRLIAEANEPKAIERLAEMTDAERGFAILAGHWEGKNAKYRRIHPMERVKNLAQITSAVKREIIADLLHSGKKKGPTRTPIPLDPAQKRAARDILTQYTAMEMHNALVLTKEVGWEKRSFLPASDVLEELKVAVPEVHAEIMKRFKKRSIFGFEGIAKAWPSLKEKLESQDTFSRVKRGEKIHVTKSLAQEWAIAKFNQQP